MLRSAGPFNLDFFQTRPPDTIGTLVATHSKNRLRVGEDVCSLRAVNAYVIEGDLPPEVGILS